MSDEKTVAVIVPRNLAIVILCTVLFGFAALWLLVESRMEPVTRYRIKIPEPVSPGGVLPIKHGMGDLLCSHPDGGIVIVRADGMDNPYGAILKRISINRRNLAPDGALSKAKIPERWPPGRYKLLLRAWCFGESQSIDKLFQFNIIMIEE